MALFVLRFTDKPGTAEIRQQYLPAHLDWMAKHIDVVLAGGSLRTESGTVPVGGMWIARAVDKASLQALLETDPFWMAGLRDKVEILHWSLAVPDVMVRLSEAV